PPPGQPPSRTNAPPPGPAGPAAEQPPVARGQAPAPGDQTAPAGPSDNNAPVAPALTKDPSGTTPPAGQRPHRPAAPPAAPKAPGVRPPRCAEVYYDVSRNVALALNGDLEIKQPGFPDPIHFRGVEIRQLAPNQFQADNAQIFSSKLPSDPGLDTTF